MGSLRIILTIAFFAASVILIIITTAQESKSRGLSGALTGSSDTDTYWSKNKSHSKEGKIVKWSWIFIAIFFTLGILLNFNILWCTIRHSL